MPISRNACNGSLTSFDEGTTRRTWQHTATHCNILQHTATHCKSLQHTATHCNTPHLSKRLHRIPKVIRREKNWAGRRGRDWKFSEFNSIGIVYGKSSSEPTFENFYLAPASFLAPGPECALMPHLCYGSLDRAAGLCDRLWHTKYVKGEQGSKGAREQGSEGQREGLYVYICSV